MGHSGYKLFSIWRSIGFSSPTKPIRKDRDKEVMDTNQSSSFSCPPFSCPSTLLFFTCSWRICRRGRGAKAASPI